MILTWTATSVYYAAVLSSGFIFELPILRIFYQNRSSYSRLFAQQPKLLL